MQLETNLDPISVKEANLNERNACYKTGSNLNRPYHRLEAFLLTVNILGHSWPMFNYVNNIWPQFYCTMCYILIFDPMCGAKSAEIKVLTIIILTSFPITLIKICLSILLWRINDYCGVQFPVRATMTLYTDSNWKFNKTVQ